MIYLAPIAIAHHYGLQVGRSNRRVTFVLCVYHAEKTPSLCMWERSQSFYCHGCGRKGSLTDLVAHLEGCLPEEVTSMTVGAGPPGPNQLLLPFA